MQSGDQVGTDVDDQDVNSESQGVFGEESLGPSVSLSVKGEVKRQPRSY